MKTLLIILCISSISFIVRAKNKESDTTYRQDSSLSRFNGEWQYTNDKIIFKIILKTEKTYSEVTKMYSDQVSGYHLYINGKKIIQNSIGEEKTLRFGYFLNKDISKNILLLSFTDLGRPLSAHAVVELLPDGQLKWHLKNREGIRTTIKGKKENRDDNFYVPNDIIMKRVK